MPSATLSAEPAGEEALKSAAASLPPPAQAAAQEANGQTTATGQTKLWGGEIAAAATAAAAAAAAAVGSSSSAGVDEKPLDAGPSAGRGGGGGGGGGEEGVPRAASAGAGAGVDITPAPMSGGDVADSSGVSGSGQELVGRQIAIVRRKSKITKEVGSPKAIYLEDIDFGTEGGMATAADILVKQARTRARVDRLKEGHVKKKERRPTEPDEKGDQRKFKLTIRMMLGVRVAVGRQFNPLASQQDGEVTAEDYAQVDKYTFPPTGATGRLATPSHKLQQTFKFRDYAPKAFKKLRGHFGIEESAYMLSVAGNYDYLELITNSKSGSFFFYSHDQKYIIKAMKSSEAKFFRKILPKYCKHHFSHPDSMLIQFCGMYMVKNGHKKIPFIVMRCVEGNTSKEIHSKYDLKGSSLGRSAKEGEKVLKDNDLASQYGKIRLGSQKAAFIKAAKADAEFLCSVNVMDYSMLTCIHDSSRHEAEGEGGGNKRNSSLERRYSNFYTFADEADDRTTPVFARLPAVASDAEGSAEASFGGDGVEGETKNGFADAEVKPAAGLMRSKSTLLCREDGGVESEVGGAAGTDVYYMGIIDILQQYNTRKHGETVWKCLRHERYKISCVDPQLYFERFVEFLDKHSD